MELFDQYGKRKYLVENERELFMQYAKESADNETRTFCLLLYYTGVRISEGLGVLLSHVDYQGKCIVIESLKRRKKGIYRQIPVPDSFLDELNMTHKLRKRQNTKKYKNQRVWTWARNTAYLRVMSVMNRAGIKGVHACPKGLRHSFAIHCMEKQIPLNMVSKWMGHSSLDMTAIYANALGKEERAIASRLW